MVFLESSTRKMSQSKSQLKTKVYPQSQFSTVIQSFRSIHIISNIFGISYFTTVNSKSFQILSKLHTLAVLIVFIACFSYRISGVSPQFCQSDAVSTSVTGIQQILAISVLIAIYYQNLFYKNRFQNLLKLTSAVDNEFFALNSHVFFYNYFGRKILFELIGMIVFICASVVFFVFYYRVQDIGLILLELFSTINPMVVIILNLMTFCNMTWFIRNKFRSLKHFLMNARAVDSLDASKSNRVWQVKLTRETPTELHRRFKKIAQIYEMLFCMVNHLNDIFGLSNLTSMGRLFDSNVFFFIFTFVKQFCKFLVALFSISLTCHLFLIFKLLTETTNNMNGIQFNVLGSTFVTL